MFTCVQVISYQYMCPMFTCVQVISYQYMPPMFTCVQVISGQYMCPNHTSSTQVEVEVIGIPADCAKFKTKVIPRNALNPIWNDVFTLQVRLG